MEIILTVLYTGSFLSQPLSSVEDIFGGDAEITHSWRKRAHDTSDTVRASTAREVLKPSYSTCSHTPDLANSSCVTTSLVVVGLLTGPLHIYAIRNIGIVCLRMSALPLPMRNRVKESMSTEQTAASRWLRITLHTAKIDGHLFPFANSYLLLRRGSLHYQRLPGRLAMS